MFTFLFGIPALGEKNARWSHEARFVVFLFWMGVDVCIFLILKN